MVKVSSGVNVGSIMLAGSIDILVSGEAAATPRMSVPELGRVGLKILTVRTVPKMSNVIREISRNFLRRRGDSDFMSAFSFRVAIYSIGEL